MKISKNNKVKLFVLLIILNIILRFQVLPREIGSDSFFMHIMANSLSEFGYARWILHPLSFVGIYPGSYTSTMQFLLSGIYQTIAIDMNEIVFMYDLFIGILSIYTAYLMAGEIIDDDLFKFFVAFGFSTAPAIIDYSTWTLTTRGLFLMTAPLMIYLLLKCRKSIKYIPIAIFFALFLFSTHHLFYFLIPSFMVFILLIIFKSIKYFNLIKIPAKFTSIFIITAFLFMFFIPFFTGRFIETSRYASIDVSYIRYNGILIIPSIGGLVYLIFKNNKRFGEWFILISGIILTMLIYKQTYMKMFIPIFLMIFAGIGLINIAKWQNRKYALNLAFIFLVLSVFFIGYYQFLHTYRENPFYERYIEESPYKTGIWMKESINGTSISNDELMSARIFSISETAHIVTHVTFTNLAYGFLEINMSDYKRYPFQSEDFWFTGYAGYDQGEILWEDINMMRSPYYYNITYYVENRIGKGNLIWRHGLIPSPLLQFAYKKDHIYDAGRIYIWKIA